MAEYRIGNSQLWILGLTLCQFGKVSERLLDADTEWYTGTRRQANLPSWMDPGWLFQPNSEERKQAATEQNGV